MTRPPKSANGFKNALLHELLDDDRDMLLRGAEWVTLPVGSTVARSGDTVSAAFFLEGGLIAMVSGMEAGYSVGVATVGAEGAFGLGSLFHVPTYPYRMMVVVESQGYRVSPEALRVAFERSDRLRRVMLSHFALRISELLAAVACQRIHSHRQRLARWLLLAVDKSGERSLHLTHEMVAELVGGPRHAVTTALHQLRATGGLAYLRGRIDVLDRSILVEQTCECYLRQHDPAGRS